MLELELLVVQMLQELTAAGAASCWRATEASMSSRVMRPPYQLELLRDVNAFSRAYDELKAL